MNTLTGKQFKQMLDSGANHLSNRHHEIDALNVFPVPDGDTGTNMHLTFSAGVKDVLVAHNEHLGDIAKILSKGLLMGARGNSGVILSQIFRGFFQSVESHNEVNAKQMASAFVRGSEVAYKAVMRPVEGTILTVLRESAANAAKFVEKNPNITIIEFMDFLIKEAHISLQNTPELLPVLKEVGVVDSGGAGLVVIFEGFRYALAGNPVAIMANIDTHTSAQLDLANDEFGYCTEFILRLEQEKMDYFSEDKLKRDLARMGDSIVVVQDEDLVKVHIHTLIPGDALNLAQRFGEFVKLKIENMQEQHAAILEHSHAHGAQKPRKKYGIIAVGAGDGIKTMFEELRADVVINGGQTMNPSTEDFVAAIRSLNAEHIIVLPNNSNIILAAQQAESICEDVDVHVLISKTIPQGLSACIMFNPEVDIDSNLEEMIAAIAHVKTGQVTYAIKDTTIDGKEIKANEYMGIVEKLIVVCIPDKVEAACRMLDHLMDDSAEIVTVIAGEDASDEEIAQVSTYLKVNFKAEVEVHKGKQPVYSFIFGVE
jgi:DAK2 domain fusion protein YloV